MEGFSIEDYSLFKIHTHIDKTGFIWINLDASENPIPWGELNGGTDEQERYKDFDLDSYVYERTWTTSGRYNWKLVGENYNEVRLPSHAFWFDGTKPPSVIIAPLAIRGSGR